MNLLYLFSLWFQSASLIEYGFVVETSLAKSKFSSPFHSSIFFFISLRLILSFPKLTIAAFRAPFSDKVLGIYLVSTLVMQGTSLIASQSVKDCFALQLDGLFISTENTQPLAKQEKDSWSY